MYAIIRAGGKQYKVAEGDVIEIERTKEDSDTVEFVPLLVVDDKGKTRSAKSDLADARVTATIVGETKGPKVNVAKYRNKTGYRRNAGHRQKSTTPDLRHRCFSETIHNQGEQDRRGDDRWHIRKALPRHGTDRDSASKRLGVKAYGGEQVGAGTIIVRQRG